VDLEALETIEDWSDLEHAERGQLLAYLLLVSRQGSLPADYGRRFRLTAGANPYAHDDWREADELLVAWFFGADPSNEERLLPCIDLAEVVTPTPCYSCEIEGVEAVPGKYEMQRESSTREALQLVQESAVATVAQESSIEAAS
jgi:hypothetical protein